MAFLQGKVPELPPSFDILHPDSSEGLFLGCNLPVLILPLYTPLLPHP